MVRSRLILALIASLLAGLSFGQADTRIKERELADVRAKIKQLKSSLADQSRSRRKLDTAMAEAEQALASAREALRETETQQVANQSALDEISADIQSEEVALASELSALGQQLRGAYTRGRNERVQLLLNGESPAELGRQLAYFRYMNRARESQIDTVRQALNRLNTLRADALERQEKLAQLQATRASQVKTTEAAVKNRQTILVSLQQEIEATGGQVAELRQREEDLERLILELSSILADYPITSEAPFANHQGELTWPVNGRLLHDFGQPRDGGEIRWNGVVLAAPRGKEVRALYHGRVAFADWLPGLGLLLVVDHGDQYLSLYGHNESLLKNVGDWVGAGDAIATIGDSGGNGEVGLYLEIRRGKQPLNPRRWITRKPRPD